MSILALLTTVVGVTVTIIDGITACCIQLSKKNLKIGDCCSDTKKETGMGEYGSVVSGSLVPRSLVSFSLFRVHDVTNDAK